MNQESLVGITIVIKLKTSGLMRLGVNKIFDLGSLNNTENMLFMGMNM